MTAIQFDNLQDVRVILMYNKNTKHYAHACPSDICQNNGPESLMEH